MVFFQALAQDTQNRHRLLRRGFLEFSQRYLISQSKAAAVAGVSRKEFLMGGGRFQVAAVQATHEELAEELGRD